MARILWLDGCERGLNRGGDMDSHARYIYIHGTAHEDRIGKPDSHGCVRMRNADIAAFFDMVEAGTPVFIG
jgi:lipoprotein-anchoring transpeptidase ErfK/SrfK